MYLQAVTLTFLSARKVHVSNCMEHGLRYSTVQAVLSLNVRVQTGDARSIN